MMLEHFLEPSVFASLESETDAALAAGTMTHRAVMEREFAALTTPLDEVVAFLLEHARVRPGFAEFVGRFDPLILSSSFHETIEPVLAREGVKVRLRANHADPRPDGWRIRWTSDSDCTTCGEPCKRASLPPGRLIYVGDGYSDRCAALAANHVFARTGLADYLADRAVPYESFTDFNALTARLATVPTESPMSPNPQCHPTPMSSNPEVTQPRCHPEPVEG